MSWSDRRYDSAGSSLGASDRPLGTWWLIGITVGFQVLVWIGGGGVAGETTRRIYDALALSEAHPYEIWRDITYAFLHGGVSHIFWNMLLLYFTGAIVEPVFGSKRFVWLYLAFAFVGGLGFTFEHVIWPSPLGDALGVGASGAVMGVIVLLGSRFPMQRMLFMFVLPMRCWVFAAVLVGLDLLALSAYRGGDQVAHSVHLMGAFAGFFVGFMWPRITVRWEAIEDERHRRAQRRERERRQEEAAEMDRILQKVHENGMDCLSPEEREFLLDQSERLKDNRRV